MHKHYTRGTVSAFALAAISVGVVTLAMRSNSGSSTPAVTGRTVNAQVNTNAVNTNQEANVNAAINASVDLAVPVVNTATPTNTLAVVRKSTTNTSKSKPKPKTPTPSASKPATGTTLSVEITFYGAYDNDPPGSRDISNGVIHSQAGGVGSYAGPLTFASPSGSGAYPVGARIYVPFLQKYFIREDVCATSWTAPNGCGAVSHVDLYMGNPSDSQKVIGCEEALTPNGNATIILNPASNLAYDPTPLWNQSTGACGRTH